MLSEPVTTEMIWSIEDSHLCQFIKTSQGRIAYRDTGGDGFPLILIHGNSCSSQVFKKQFLALSKKFRLIAIDLPGHGKSERPREPDKIYTIPGYAKVLDEVLSGLGLESFAVLGYSLGGNIALQYSQLTKKTVKGILLVSSAPIKYSAEALLAYPPSKGNFATYPHQLTEDQAKQYMSSCGFQIDDPTVYFMVEDAVKTDPKSRSTMVASVGDGKGIDETEIIQKLEMPIAFIAGKKDRSLGHDYLKHLKFNNLWRGNIQWIQEAKHALPLHQADQLNHFIEEFLGNL